VERLRRQRTKAAAKHPLIFTYVRQRLFRRWSPETIAGRLRLEHPGLTLHHETIYRYVYHPAQQSMVLWQYLTLGRKRRMHKHGRRPQVGALGDRQPDGAADGARAISTTVERRTRFTLLTKLPDGTAEAKYRALLTRLRRFPRHVRRSLTTDNGHENAKHEWLTWKLSLPVYFCHAYASWEKGSVENLNGRIRRVIPKGTSIQRLSYTQVAAVEEWLNTTPRNCLGYRTPVEVMLEALGTAARLAA
jgi:transposase, IS30 family